MRNTIAGVNSWPGSGVQFAIPHVDRGAKWQIARLTPRKLGSTNYSILITQFDLN
jgi:hypothetical protein